MRVQKTAELLTFSGHLKWTAQHSSVSLSAALSCLSAVETAMCRKLPYYERMSEIQEKSAAWIVYSASFTCFHFENNFGLSTDFNCSSKKSSYSDMSNPLPKLLWIYSHELGCLCLKMISFSAILERAFDKKLAS